MKDQRWYIRYKIQGTANLKPKIAGSFDIKAELMDLSYRGFAAWADASLEAGTDVDFELSTKLWDQPITGKGQIKYVQESKKDERVVFRVGVEFKEIDKKTLQSIINLLVQDICQQSKKKTV